MRSINPVTITAGTVMVLALTLVGAVSPAMSQEEAFTIEKNVLIGPGGAYLGIEMEDVTADTVATYKLTGERGVIVRNVIKGSPAEAATLQEKDVILEYAGTVVFSAQQMSRLVRETPVGRKVDLVVSREGKKMNLTAKIGKRERGQGMIEGEPDIMMFGAPGGHTFRFPAPEGDMHPPGPGRRWFGTEEPSSRPRLGVTLQPLTDQMADFLGVPGKKGVLVSSTIEDTPAAGKLKAGDVIVSADNQPIGDPEDLTRVVRGKSEGGAMELKVVRDRKEISVSVELAGTAPKPKPKGYKL